MLAGCTFEVAIFSRSLPLDMQARVLAVMGFVAVGFLSFITEINYLYIQEVNVNIGENIGYD